MLALGMDHDALTKHWSQSQWAVNQYQPRKITSKSFISQKGECLVGLWVNGFAALHSLNLY